ncbi:hypothetical protein D3OALGA1CA_4118 [Olavius algarvensis associated proteobacterium Delta 3]|nr:hypothetical protein D3OALGA1CA_4118 [Olavius algarvensis associated proteobacterium Delta 3]
MTRKWFHTVCIITALIFFAGCESKAPPPPPEKKMVRKKISAGKAPVAQKKKTPAPAKPKAQPQKTATPPPKATAKAAPVKPKPAKITPAAPAVAPSPKPSTAQKAAAPAKTAPPAAAPKPKPAQPGAKPDLGPAPPGDNLSKVVATARGVTRGGAQKIRVDPFKSPIAKQPEQRKTGTRKKPAKPKRPKTPLERLDLRQLKLTAIIATPRGRKALVEEASGKGYVIRKGTYIGVHEGQVVEIASDRVIVREEIENAIGESVVNKRELRLPRRFGE